MAFLGIIPSWKSCYIFIYGDAKNPWFKRKKVCFINHILISQQLPCHIVLLPHASFKKFIRFSILVVMLYMQKYMFWVFISMRLTNQVYKKKKKKKEHHKYQIRTNTHLVFCWCGLTMITFYFDGRYFSVEFVFCFLFFFFFFFFCYCYIF